MQASKRISHALETIGLVLAFTATWAAASGAGVSIVSPGNGATVSGQVTISTMESSTVSWINVFVDGAWVASNAPSASPPYAVNWNSAAVSNGRHTLSIDGYNSKNALVASASITVKVANGVAASPTPGATASPAKTPVSTPTQAPVKSPTPVATKSASPGPSAQASAAAGHYSMLPPGASLPSEASCAAQVNASPQPENAPWNQNDGTGFDSNTPPTGGVPSYFYQNAPGGSEMTSADFATVDGKYSGSTDDIFRVYACKWGIDEDYIRAQAWVETGWHQDCAAAHGGSGCQEGGDENNPSGCVTGLLGVLDSLISANGEFCAMEGFGGLRSPNQYDSWSIVQNKVYYAWMTWPMMEESTPFGIDFRFAEMRGCVNGDQLSYFQSQGTGTNYQNAVDAARSNPTGASSVSGWSNLQYLAYGCIDTHYSGDWFKGNADSYLDQFLSALDEAPWPGGLK